MSDSRTAEIRNVKIQGGVIGRASELVKNQVIPYQWDILNDRNMDAVPDHSIENFSVADGDVKEYPSHCIANFKIAAGEEKGEFYGMVFQDSDLAKWLETASYKLMSDPDEKLEQTIDETVDLIGRAQQKDGYLNTYFTIKEPGKRFTNLCECHELYCAGHMIEAAVAYYKATGKDKLLNIMRRMADLIDQNFGPEKYKRHGYPGHEEIELALVKLFQVTHEERYLKLAKYFIDERGKNPHYFDIEFEKRNRASHFSYMYPPYGMYSMGPKYEQYHLPIREQKEFVGHAVRCMYMASGAADVARLTGDKELFDVVKGLYQNMVERRMYLTGSIGSTPQGEMFTADYDLPNDMAYSETCASVGIAFFTKRLLLADHNAQYADTMERAIYNTVIAGMSLDGKNFFYVNPLEVDPILSRENPDKKHVLPVRPAWFGCACCPPNLSRLITSLPEYIYTLDGDTVYVNLFVKNKAHLDLDHTGADLRIETEYPYDDQIRFITDNEARYELCIRIPSWTGKAYIILVNGKEEKADVRNGYAVLNREWHKGDTVILKLDVTPKRIYANPHVADDVGKVAIQCGPLVYCLEGVDNGDGLQRLFLPADEPLTVVKKPDKLKGIWEIHTKGLKLRDRKDDNELYTANAKLEYDLVDLTYIPYYSWANRGENEMTVWVHETK